MLAGGASDVEVTLDNLAFEGTKQTRPDSVSPIGSVAAHLLFCGQGRRRNHVQRDRNLGEDHSANVRCDAKGGEGFV